jgi:hypothetical protein
MLSTLDIEYLRSKPHIEIDSEEILHKCDFVKVITADGYIEITRKEYEDSVKETQNYLLNKDK